MKNRITSVSMRKILLLLFISLVLVFVPQICLASEQTIIVIIDDTVQNFEQPPTYVNDRVLVPMRSVFETLGAQVDWNGETQTVVAYTDRQGVAVQIDNSLATLFYVNNWGTFIDERTLELDVPPKIINGRTMVPIRVASESLGAKVFWEDDTKTVRIFKDPFGASCLLYEAALKEKNQATIDRSNNQPLDADGLILNIGDVVKNGGFSGSVLDINGSKILVYWDSKSIFVPEDDVDYWAGIAGIKYKSNQWLESQEVQLESSAYNVG